MWLNFILGYKNIPMLTCKLFITMTLCCVVLGICTNFAIYQNSLQINTNDICIEQYDTTECLKFYKTFKQTDLPQKFPRFTFPIERPTDIDVTVLDSEYDDWIYPGLTIRWMSPMTGVTYWYGHLVVWFPENSEDMRCRLFLMKNVNNTEYLYEYKVPIVQENTVYVVRVYSLPPFDPEYKNDDRTFAQKRIETGSAYKVGQPGEWSPHISHKSLDDGTIKARFSLPPAKFNITTFSVYLMNELDLVHPVNLISYKAPLRTKEITEASLDLKANVTGSYQIVIWPEDEYRMQPEKCQCWIIENDIKTCKSNCKGSTTEWFYVNITANSS